MDSPELFEYLPKTITSIGATVKIGEEAIIDSTKHSIAHTSNYTLLHHDIEQISPDTLKCSLSNHIILYVKDQKIIHRNIIEKVGTNAYDYSFLLDENKIISYGKFHIDLLEIENGKSRRLFESIKPIYFRIDDNRNIIILYDVLIDDNLNFKITTLKKENDYKREKYRNYSMPRISKYFVDHNFYNLLFISQLNETIMHYYYREHRFIVIVNHNDKNDTYDVLTFRSTGYIERWSYQPDAGWTTTKILSDIDMSNFHLLNRHFNRRIIANYCNKSYNFGTVVTESYNEWLKRMIEILENAIERLSTDLLKLIVCFI